jgi:hypothetical protein
MMALSILACQVGGISLGDERTVRGSGDVVEENRTVSDFTAVELATLGTLHIEVGDAESLRIEAEDNLMDYLETEVLNGSLRIGTQEDIRLDATKPVRYYLTVTGLDTIVISSSGNIEMGELEADALEVDISSSGDLDIASGQVKAQNVTISSSGNYTAEDLVSTEAEVRLNSSGSATIWVQDFLKANLNSSGDLRYRGNPTVDATTNSSGDVIQIGE